MRSDKTLWREKLLKSGEGRVFTADPQLHRNGLEWCRATCCLDFHLTHRARSARAGGRKQSSEMADQRPQLLVGTFSLLRPREPSSQVPCLLRHPEYWFKGSGHHCPSLIQEAASNIPSAATVLAIFPLGSWQPLELETADLVIP